MSPRTLLTGLERARNRDRGVTLVEMMVVVVILGILATVSTLIITTIFNANIQGGEKLSQQTTVQTASNFFETRLASASTGAVGQKTASGSAINPTSIAGDQAVFTSGGTCYRLIYLPQAKDLVAATQPVDSSTGACKTGPSGISPTRGPTQSSPADPVLDSIDATTGALKSSSNLPSDANVFTLASNVQSLGSSGEPPLSYCNATCTSTIPVDATADANSSTSWYSTPSNLKSVSSVEVNLEVLGAQAGADAQVGPQLYSQVYYLGANDSGGTLADASTGSSGYHARLATTAPLPANTDSSGTLTASAPGALGSIDGTAVNVGDRILVNNEANAADNGVYDVVDTGSSMSNPVTVKDGLNSLGVLDPLNRSETLSDGGKWSTLTFGGTQVLNGQSPTPAKVTISSTGSDSTTGWYGVSAGSVAGAYWNAAQFSGSGSNQGTAAAATLKTSSCSGGANRYVALWLNMPAPSSGQSGYEVQFNCTGSGTTGAYISNVELDKWVAGTKTALQTVNAQTITDGSRVGITDLNGTVAVYVDSGSGWSQLLSAPDTTFTYGYAGIMNSGSNGSVTNFEAGTFTTSNGAGGSTWKLVRAPGTDVSSDYEASGDFPAGSLVTVSEGTQNASTIWQLQALKPANGWTVDSNPQNFVAKDGSSASSGGFQARLATTGPLPDNSLSNNILTANDPGALQVDGTSVNAGDSVLVTSERNAAKDGLYNVTDPGSNGGGTPVTVQNTLSSLPVRDAFTITTGAMASGWSMPQWVTKQGNTYSAWYSAGTTVAANYWNASTFAESGTATGVADEIAVKTSTCAAVGDYMSLWVDMSAPATAKSGYQAKIACTAVGSNVYNVEIDKWSAGTKTVLATVPNQTVTNGTTLAFAAINGTLRVFTNNGSGSTFTFMDGASASDSAFTSGYTGFEALGTWLASSFNAGTITTVTPSGSAPWKLTRAAGTDATADYQSGGGFAPGSLVTVSDGVQNANTIWQLQKLSPANGWTLNSSPLNFVIQAGTNSVGTTDLQNKAVGAGQLDYSLPFDACAVNPSDDSQAWTGELLQFGACSGALPAGVTFNNASWCGPTSGGLCHLSTFIGLDSSYIGSPNEYLQITVTLDAAFGTGGILVGQIVGGTNNALGSATIAQFTAGQRATVTNSNIVKASDLAASGSRGGTAPYAFSVNLTGNLNGNLVYGYHTKVTVVPLPY